MKLTKIELLNTINSVFNELKKLTKIELLDTINSVFNEAKLVGEDKDYYKKLSEEYRFNPIVTLAAVKINGMSLEYTSDYLKNNKEVVLEAIKQNRSALQFASEELQKEWKDKTPEQIESIESKKPIELITTLVDKFRNTLVDKPKTTNKPPKP